MPCMIRCYLFESYNDAGELGDVKNLCEWAAWGQEIMEAAGKAGGESRRYESLKP